MSRYKSKIGPKKAYFGPKILDQFQITPIVIKYIIERNQNVQYQTNRVSQFGVISLKTNF